MTDPTLATVDDEPWNRCSPPTPASITTAIDATIHQIADRFSVYERVMRRIPILVNGAPAQYVYDRIGISVEPECCYGCDARCLLTLWHEWRYAPNEPVPMHYNRDYTVSRSMSLCNTCSNKLKALPLGTQWKAKP